MADPIDVQTSSVLGIALSCADVICSANFWPSMFSTTLGNYLFQAVISIGYMIKILQIVLVYLLPQGYFSINQVLDNFLTFQMDGILLSVNMGSKLIKSQVIVP